MGDSEADVKRYGLLDEDTEEGCNPKRIMAFLWGLNSSGHVMAHQTGSNFTCDPPVTNTDVDFVVYYGNDIVLRRIESEGFLCTTNSKEYGAQLGSSFKTYRKGVVNLICTDNVDFYFAFVGATRVCKELNLLNKKDRVTVFQAILYKNYPK
jgi:hypothetical protein